MIIQFPLLTFSIDLGLLFNKTFKCNDDDVGDGGEEGEEREAVDRARES